MESERNVPKAARVKHKSTSVPTTLGKETLNKPATAKHKSTSVPTTLGTLKRAPQKQKTVGVKSSGKSMTVSIKPKKAKSRIEYLQSCLLDPTTKLYCLFLKSSTPVFNSVNLLLQREERCVHVLQDELMRLLTELYIRFLTPAAIAECDDMLTIDFKDMSEREARLSHWGNN